MNKLFICCFITLFQSLYSQNQSKPFEIGLLFDNNEILIDGLLENDYSPKHVFEKTHNTDNEFTPGCYYDLNCKRIPGWLKSSPDSEFIRYKATESSDVIKITPNQCIAYIVGSDSFTVAKNFNIERGLSHSFVEEQQFIMILDSINGNTFYSHKRINQAGILFTYLVKPTGSNNYLSFPKDKINFSALALQYFGECPELKYQLTKKHLNNDDIPNMLRQLKYYALAKSGKRIYLLPSWNITPDSTKAAMYSIASSSNGKVLTLKYFYKDGTPIFQGNYSSFHPEKRTGEFIYFYPNAQIRKKETYSKGFKDTTTTYYPNGNLQLQYTWQKKYNYYGDPTANDTLVNDENSTRYTPGNYSANNSNGLTINDVKQPFAYKDNIEDRWTFQIINLPNGTAGTDSLGNGSIEIFDSTNQRNITFTFKKFQLATAYYLRNENEKIYLLCDRNANFTEIKTMNDRLYSNVKYPFENDIVETTGLLLIKCVVEPSGKVSSYKIAKGINTNIDNQVHQQFACTLYNPMMRCGVVDKNKVTQEILIPFVFKYTKTEGFNSYQNFWLMQQQWSMKHQMQTPNIKPITIPNHF